MNMKLRLFSLAFAGGSLIAGLTSCAHCERARRIDGYALETQTVEGQEVLCVCETNTDGNGQVLFSLVPSTTAGETHKTVYARGKIVMLLSDTNGDGLIDSMMFERRELVNGELVLRERYLDQNADGAWDLRQLYKDDGVTCLTQIPVECRWITKPMGKLAPTTGQE